MFPDQTAERAALDPFERDGAGSLERCGMMENHAERFRAMVSF